MSPLLLILTLLILANLPWFTSRFLVFFPLKSEKSVGLRILELLVFYFVSLFVAALAEMQFSGDIHPQQWEFYATTFSGFLVLSVPGLVYRYQWLSLKKKTKRRAGSK